MASVVAEIPQLNLSAMQAALAIAFERAGVDSPALDARLLITHALGLEPMATLIMPLRPVSHAEASLIDEFACRRMAGEPVSRILGRRSFFGLDLEIGPATLDPRPDTEALVEGVLKHVQAGCVTGGRAPKILDLGTGSGAIILALLMSLPEASGVATDIQPDALEIAARNARRLGLDRRCDMKVGCWLDGIDGQFDIVVSNPPYIESAAIPALDPEVSMHDPLLSLDGGHDGLDAYRAIIPAVAKVLVPGGLLAFEIGLGQDRWVRHYLEMQSGSLDIQTIAEWSDLSGMTRCVAVRSLC